MSDQKRGILTIISGFSGAGKGTVVGRLLEKYPERYKLSISATTRSPRNGEEHGVHYFCLLYTSSICMTMVKLTTLWIRRHSISSLCLMKKLKIE